VSQATLQLVIDSVREVLQEEGIEPGELTADTKVLEDTGLDSLALALVVVKMEERTGQDPFAEGFVNFQTVGELADLYKD
jgi:acyl carrier protein